MDEAAAAAPAPASAAGDLSQGYCVKLYVLPSGAFSVGEPEALTPGEAGGEEQPSVGAALKALLQVVQENPVGGDANTELEAGYAAR